MARVHHKISMAYGLNRPRLVTSRQPTGAGGSRILSERFPVPSKAGREGRRRRRGIRLGERGEGGGEV